MISRPHSNNLGSRRLTRSGVWALSGIDSAIGARRAEETLCYARDRIGEIGIFRTAAFGKSGQTEEARGSNGINRVHVIHRMEISSESRLISRESAREEGR